MISEPRKPDSVKRLIYRTDFRARRHMRVRMSNKRCEPNAAADNRRSIASEHGNADVTAGAEIDHDVLFAIVGLRVGEHLGRRVLRILIGVTVIAEREFYRGGFGLVVHVPLGVGTAVPKTRRENPIGALGLERELSFRAETEMCRFLAVDEWNIIID